MLKNEVIIVMKCREPLKLEYENHSSDHGNGYSGFEWAMWAEQIQIIAPKYQYQSDSLI